MKAIMISDKPKWCALMMNGEKTIEVRKNKALANAIQKLIDEYGYADIYVYCSKINKKHYHLIESIDTDTGKTEYEIDYYIGSGDYLDYCYEGKVAFKFRCYKVEEWDIWQEDLEEKIKLACLSIKEFDDYSKGQVGYAIHISDLEIFDKPKELSEFHLWEKDKIIRAVVNKASRLVGECLWKPLTKAPQNFCYVEVER